MVRLMHLSGVLRCCMSVRFMLWAEGAVWLIVLYVRSKLHIYPAMHSTIQTVFGCLIV